MLGEKYVHAVDSISLARSVMATMIDLTSFL